MWWYWMRENLFSRVLFVDAQLPFFLKRAIEFVDKAIS
ncbi:hypothetical protein yaldo0001_33580 [Yersinia aldovae ATCC 35236]|nr:hypothetical protein yaldo0001_33580 [Yersinia aldovae ATCC 35236]